MSSGKRVLSVGGTRGVERRIDVIAMAIQQEAAVFDLAQCDFSVRNLSCGLQTYRTFYLER